MAPSNWMRSRLDISPVELIQARDSTKDQQPSLTPPPFLQAGALAVSDASFQLSDEPQLLREFHFAYLDYIKILDIIIVYISLFIIDRTRSLRAVPRCDPLDGSREAETGAVEPDWLESGPVGRVIRLAAVQVAESWPRSTRRSRIEYREPVTHVPERLLPMSPVRTARGGKGRNEIGMKAQLVQDQLFTSPV
jgi:hypothetical protein